MKVFRKIQECVVKELEIAPLFSPAVVPVLSRLRKSAGSDVDEALASVGITAFVLTPEPETSRPNVPGPDFDSVELVVRVMEAPDNNATGIDAWDAWEEIVRRLHCFDLKPLIPGCGSIHVQTRPFADSSPADRNERWFDALFRLRANLTIPRP